MAMMVMIVMIVKIMIISMKEVVNNFLEEYIVHNNFYLLFIPFKI